MFLFFYFYFWIEATNIFYFVLEPFRYLYFQRNDPSQFNLFGKLMGWGVVILFYWTFVTAIFFSNWFWTVFHINLSFCCWKSENWTNQKFYSINHTKLWTILNKLHSIGHEANSIAACGNKNDIENYDQNSHKYIFHTINWAIIFHFAVFWDIKYPTSQCHFSTFIQHRSLHWLQ